MFNVDESQLLGVVLLVSMPLKMAVGLGGEVTILDVNHQRLEYLDDVFQGRVRTMYSNVVNIEESVAESDLVIGGINSWLKSSLFSD